MTRLIIPFCALFYSFFSSFEKLGVSWSGIRRKRLDDWWVQCLSWVMRWIYVSYYSFVDFFGSVDLQRLKKFPIRQPIIAFSPIRHRRRLRPVVVSQSTNYFQIEILDEDVTTRHWSFFVPDSEKGYFLLLCPWWSNLSHHNKKETVFLNISIVSMHVEIMIAIIRDFTFQNKKISFEQCRDRETQDRGRVVVKERRWDSRIHCVHAKRPYWSRGSEGGAGRE